MHMGHHGSPDLIDDHLPERSLGNVWVFLNHRVIRFKGSMKCKIFFGTFVIVRVLTRERRKSYAVIQKLFEKEFRSNGD
jgi:hypothetical protein